MILSFSSTSSIGCQAIEGKEEKGREERLESASQETGKKKYKLSVSIPFHVCTLFNKDCEERGKKKQRERNNCKECSPSSSLLFLWLWFLLWLSVSSSSSFFPNFVCRLASLLPACLSLSTSIISWFSIQDKKTAILLFCSCLLRADNLLFPSNSIFGLNH